MHLTLWTGWTGSMATSLDAAPLPPPLPRPPMEWAGQTATLPLILLHHLTITTLPLQPPPLPCHAMATTASRAALAITLRPQRLPQPQESQPPRRRSSAAVGDSRHHLATATTLPRLQGRHRLPPSCPRQSHSWHYHKTAGIA